jgi:hypothetical protein
MQAMLESLCIAILISTSKNALSSYYAYVFSSTKLEIKAEQFCLEARGAGRRGWRKGEREEMTQCMHI